MNLKINEVTELAAKVQIDDANKAHLNLSQQESLDEEKRHF